MNTQFRARIVVEASTAQLTEGKTYTIKATTTNMSFMAGVPVAAILSVNIAAVVDSQAIMEDSDVYNFAAEESHTFEFSMVVPMGAGGKTGAVVAVVIDPAGIELADGSLDIEILPAVIPAFTYSNVSAQKVTFYVATAFDTMIFRCRVTNPSDTTLTKTMRLIWRFWSNSDPSNVYTNVMWMFSLTLAPGQYRDFVWDGNTYGQRTPTAYNGPNISRRTTHCMHLEDGVNESAEACVTRN